MGENGRRGQGSGATFIDKRAARRPSEAGMERGEGIHLVPGEFRGASSGSLPSAVRRWDPEIP